MTLEAEHAARMNAVYRWQRHLYDFTRKYYLFGRDRLIDGLDLPGSGQGVTVLEVACGTGRNLACIRGKWPDAELFGIDISSEMLRTARAKLGTQASLANADATSFDPGAIFGRQQFDRVVLSYCVSMIPSWREAIGHACGLVAPGGSLHLVDFGDFAGLPAPATALIRHWLARFHVTPRSDLVAEARALASGFGFGDEIVPGPAGYYQLVRLGRSTGK